MGAYGVQTILALLMAASIYATMYGTAVYSSQVGSLHRAVEELREIEVIPKESSSTIFGSGYPQWSKSVDDLWPTFLGDHGQQLLAFAAVNIIYISVAWLCRRWGFAAELRWTAVAGVCALCIFLGVFGAAVVLFLSSCNFALAQHMRGKTARFHHSVVWAFVLFSMDIIFRWIGDDVRRTQLEIALTGSPLGMGVTQGLAPWLCYRFIALRHISYAFDLHFFQNGITSRMRNLSSKPVLVQQTELPLSNAADYCFTWYVAYLFYVPLFIFGPVLSYNAFVAQMKNSQITYGWAQIERYGLQIVGSILVMEVFLGKVWYPPLMNSATSDELLNSFGSWELLCGVHCRLVYSWATLFIIWRTSRFFALLHGVDSPENMVAVSMPIVAMPSFVQFWRIWHASLNLWAVRYLYTPAGGREKAAVSVPLTFLFIAYLHESCGFLSAPQWYAWAALNAIGVFLEKSVPTQDASRGSRFAVAGITAAALVLANLPADFGALSVTIGIRLASNWPLVLLAFAMACVGHVHMEAKEIENSGSCNGKEQHAHCVELIDPCVRTDSK
jgi:D-alanyl-lipoteichoic acid acyltransferase DltB (MBOAT superfamily)